MTPAARTAAAELAAVLLELGPAGTPCRRGDGGDWYREGRVTDDAAAALCAGCRAIRPCLNYALAADERWGVWGGTSPQQRRRQPDPITDRTERTAA